MSERKLKSLSDLPEQCYAVIDGRLCIVTRGEKGYQRAPVSAENSAANHELATLKNKELGVTPEQVKLLVTGSVIGWDAWITPQKSAKVAHELFEVELCRPGGMGYADIKLPATSWELQDALDKAGITDKRAIYTVEMLSCRLDCLETRIPGSANLYELNHLAQRLDGMTDWEQSCFEGLVEMETAKGVGSIPVERLINFTHSLEHCQIAFAVSNDAELGKFYVENDFPVIPPNLPEVLYEMLDYEAIGRRERTGEGGVFTKKGYVVNSGGISEIYQSGGVVPQEKPSHTIELELCKGNFNDSDYDSRCSEYPLLPADDGIIHRAVTQVEASSMEECSLQAVDCAVPKLTELISDSLYESEGDCYGAVNELAGQLKKLSESGKLLTYKAMVEVAPADLTLEEAIDLAGQAVDFTVKQDMQSPKDYAEQALAKSGVPLADELIACANLHRYGQMLMERDNVTQSSYGALIPLDGHTVEQCLDRPASGLSMEMR